MNAVWFTALLVFAATVFGTVSLALVWEAGRDWLRNREVGKRLKPILSGTGAMDKSLDLVRAFEAKQSVLTESVPGIERTNTLLAQARLDWRAESFILIIAGATLAAGGAILLATGSIFFAWLAALAAAFAPFQYVRLKRNKRFNDFEEQFPEAIDLLTRAIRAGHPLASGMRMVGEEGPPEVAQEFRQSFEEQRFGLPFEDALLGLVDRMDTVDVRIFAIAVLVQREVGGNLAEILDNLAMTIRSRFYIRRQLRVYTAQGRLSGYILAALPVVVGTILYLMEPEYVGQLFTTFIGWLMVGTAVFLQVVGYLWIRKIINIEI
jgi:tight adherence protein B